MFMIAARHVSPMSTKTATIIDIHIFILRRKRAYYTHTYVYVHVSIQSHLYRNPFVTPLKWMSKHVKYSSVGDPDLPTKYSSGNPCIAFYVFYFKDISAFLLMITIHG